MVSLSSWFKQNMLNTKTEIRENLNCITYSYIMSYGHYFFTVILIFNIKINSEYIEKN